MYRPPECNEWILDGNLRKALRIFTASPHILFNLCLTTVVSVSIVVDVFVAASLFFGVVFVTASVAFLLFVLLLLQLLLMLYLIGSLVRFYFRCSSDLVTIGSYRYIPSTCAPRSHTPSCRVSGLSYHQCFFSRHINMSRISAKFLRSSSLGAQSLGSNTRFTN